MGLVREIEPAEPPLPLPTTDQLIVALSAADPERRRESALELDGVPAAVPALLARVGVEAEPVVRDAMLTTLAALATDEVAAGLAYHLGSDDAALRTAVARTLGAMPGPVPGLIPGLISDPDHDIRILAAMVLADLHDLRAPAWLVQLIRSDPHPNVVAAALDAFLPAATAEDMDLLMATSGRFPEDPFLTFTVDTAVARLGGAGP